MGQRPQVYLQGKLMGLIRPSKNYMDAVTSQKIKLTISNWFFFHTYLRERFCVNRHRIIYLAVFIFEIVISIARVSNIRYQLWNLTPMVRFSELPVGNSWFSHLNPSMVWQRTIGLYAEYSRYNTFRQWNGTYNDPKEKIPF